MTSDEAEVLAANRAFYRAFARRDMAAMEAIWATRPGTSCIHPGRGAISRRDAVMQSWAAILANPNAPAIVAHAEVAHVLGEVAYVTCHEVIEDTFLAATNVFVREGGAWKLVHHHAGPSVPPAGIAADTPKTLQ